MAPSPITNDYYMMLEVKQSATRELIIKSYKRLTLKLHSNRNVKQNATEAFQLMCQFFWVKLNLLSIICIYWNQTSKLERVYETLRNEIKRQVYDLIYLFVTRRRFSSQTAQTSRSSSTSTLQSEALNEAAQIAALQKFKQERDVRWRIKKKIFDSSIFELQRGIRQLEQEIKNLDSIFDAETTIEAQKNIWRTWLLSSIFKKTEDSEKKKTRKDRERQKRRIEKDMKKRRLGFKKTKLKREEDLSDKTKKKIDVANLSDENKI